MIDELTTSSGSTVSYHDWAFVKYEVFVYGTFSEDRSSNHMTEHFIGWKRWLCYRRQDQCSNYSGNELEIVNKMVTFDIGML